jgi:hypothetical protein
MAESSVFDRAQTVVNDVGTAGRSSGVFGDLGLTGHRPGKRLCRCDPRHGATRVKRGWEQTRFRAEGLKRASGRCERCGSVDVRPVAQGGTREARNGVAQLPRLPLPRESSPLRDRAQMRRLKRVHYLGGAAHRVLPNLSAGVAVHR